MYVILEHILVGIIVVAAITYVGRTLWKESRGGGCVCCNCCEKAQDMQKLIQLVPDKPASD